MSGKRTTVILTSAVGLGVYIPALLIQRNLRSMDHVAEVEVLESLFTPERLAALLAHRKAHHENFALAQIANRMVRDVEDCLDTDRVQALLERWVREQRSRFIVWSGFWLPLIERYRALVTGLQLEVDHCRIDADISASFRVFPQLRTTGNEIWLWHGASGRVLHEIPVAAAPVPEFTRRPQRLVVHGGGWGIGTYRDTLTSLRLAGYGIDLVVHSTEESAGQAADTRCYMLDPAWEPWRRSASGEHIFPPMGEVSNDSPTVFAGRDDYHVFHDVIRRARAIVSKPGGCTLIDSLAAATPVIFLEAYSQAEQCNAQVWEKLGYGISLHHWAATGYSLRVLEEMHHNIIARRPAIDYPAAWAVRGAAEVAA